MTAFEDEIIGGKTCVVCGNSFNVTRKHANMLVDICGVECLIVMAAMRQADDENIAKLSAAFLDTYRELKGRYNTPGGFLSQEEKEGI